MKDRALLKLLDKFKKLFEKMDIDYGSLRSILDIKLLLDGRRSATILQNPNTKNKKEKNNFLSSLWIYLFLGLVMIPLVMLGDEYLFQMSLVFAMFMFFMITSLISDFSSVLLDVRDKDILLSRPINSKTLNTAKFIHITYYMFMTSMALIGPSLLASLFKRGVLFFIIFLFEIILIDLFLIVITGLLYLFILKFFDGEKLKDMINYVQIGLTITITVGYQLLIRVFDIVDLQIIEFQDKFWTYLLPPIWFSAPFEYIFKGSRQSYIIIYSILAILVPTIAIIVYVKTMPIFERNLQKLTSTGGVKKSKTKRLRFISKIVCRNREERNFYRFSTNMLKNERVFKLRVYPNLGFGLIFPFLMIFPFIADSSFNEIRSSNMYLSIYFIAFALFGIVQFLGYSGNYKGSFIYKTMPIKEYSSIYKGALKAAFVNLFTPLFIFEAIIFLIVFGMRIFPDLILVYIISNKNLPFSQDFEMIKKGKFLEMIATLFVSVIPFLIHLFAFRFSFGIYIYIFLAIVVNLLVWKYIFKEKNPSIGYNN
ncbi:MAG: hypothetical protein ACTHW2_00505 [Tissierella sp.]|uniref:hypothetical protein n=1 Tax=Tissierella sp. TaxID=41274 RepID=UPI003F9CE1C6